MTLLRVITDSRLDIDVPLARHAISSVSALSFKIGDLSNPDTVESTTLRFRSSTASTAKSPSPEGYSPDSSHKHQVATDADVL